MMVRSREKPAKRPARGALPMTRISKPFSMLAHDKGENDGGEERKERTQMHRAAEGRQQLPAGEGDGLGEVEALRIAPGPRTSQSSNIAAT